MLAFKEGGGQVEVEKQSCICHEMQELLKEQRIIAGIDMEFQFMLFVKKDGYHSLYALLFK